MQNKSLPKEALKGKAYIKSQIDFMPELPGVYRMININGEIIYIGKAKNIRDRVRQYTLVLNRKNEEMVLHVTEISVVICESEVAALLLEGQLIKKYKPKYNILLKDDKSFPYIYLRGDHAFPQLMKYRSKGDKHLEKGLFFGPFAAASKLNTTLTELQKIFKLRTCSDSYFQNRQRPCILYDIKRCSAPCTGKVTAVEYEKQVAEAVTFLKGHSKKLQLQLSVQMEGLSADERYEEAAIIRDKIKALSYIQLNSGTDGEILNETDIFALAFANGKYCIQLFIYRSGQLCGDKPYFIDVIEGETSSDVISAFLLQFYQDREIPKEIIISVQLDDKTLIEKALNAKANKKIIITQTLKGGKKRLVENCVINAQKSLENTERKRAKNLSVLSKIQKIFDLRKIPSRIEVYDNSHIQGSNAVGAMVVCGQEGFDKKEYRIYNIQNNDDSKIGGDDYAMLQEVLTRRFKKLLTKPLDIDLMIIDGGKGHMKVVQGVMEKFGLKIPFICMSKGLERDKGGENFHMPGRAVFTLDNNSAEMKYLQILRDEVHNFAITTHRKRRSRDIKTSTIEDIPGIGQGRKKLLLHYFGSLQEVKNATIDELSQVKGISSKIAHNIYQSLRKNI